jgi:uncharacterized protein YjbI with pentapeptide repeats
MKACCQVRLLALPLILLCLQGCDRMALRTNNIDELNAALKEYPNLLDNYTMQGKQLNGNDDNGVRMENMVIRNLTMRDVEMRFARLKNVTFVDCTFIKADFRYSVFDNVQFIRGSMSGYDKPDDMSEYETRLEHIFITRVLFDGVNIGQSVDIDLRDGVVVMRNIKAELPPNKNYHLLGGSNVQVRMDNCRVANQTTLVALGEKSSLYATNSSFINSKLDLPGQAAWIENCTWSEGYAPDTNTLVVTNSQLSGIQIGAGTGNGGKEDGERRVFLVNNTYTESKEPHSSTLFLLATWDKMLPDNSHLYLYGKADIPGRVVVHSGNVHIYNATIDLVAMRQGSAKCSLANLNLQNVNIAQGRWEYGDVRQGKWENVNLGSPIDLNGAKFGNIIGHQVAFPQGIPWKNGELTITPSPYPLEFDKPPVPTLEELGLAQFWQENDFPPVEY